MPQMISSPQAYDAIIVGSGAGGGIAAYNLTKSGAKCLMLEAGSWYDTARDSKWLEWTYSAPHRGALNTAGPADYFSAVVGGWQVEGEPYRSAPGSDFMWFRSRMLGGRTNSWGRISLRNGPYDFKPHSRDGMGFDWPFAYEELAPYYDKTEELIGVFGSKEEIENLPDGKFLPPPAPRCYELMVQKACRSLKILAPRNFDARAQRAAALPLRFPVRPLLPARFQLLISGRATESRADHRESRDSLRRHGARSSDRHGRPRHWRFLH
jgi:choline dehydrogenase-like flavoprotein